MIISYFTFIEYRKIQYFIFNEIHVFKSYKLFCFKKHAFFARKIRAAFYVIFYIT